MKPHKDFRLWMTAEVHPKFPTILLQSSLKITYEVSLKKFSLSDKLSCQTSQHKLYDFEYV